MAKYVIQWTNRDSDLAGAKRLLDLFSKWTPAAADIQQFVSRIDGTGGFSIVETDNPANVLRDVSKFAEFLEFDVYPVIDIGDAVPIFNEAIDYAESIP